jgi:hypothetical protein
MSTETSTDQTDEALVAALIELERHIGEDGWDQPPRLFALVRTDEVIAAEPELVDRLGLRGSADGAPADALTAIEQDHFQGTGDVLADLEPIVWPDTVFGCALALERTFLPSSAEPELPEDPAAAAEFVAQHPDRQDVRVVVGVDRAGNTHGVARLVSRPEDLLAAPDLVPGLGAALAHTLKLDEPEV